MDLDARLMVGLFLLSAFAGCSVAGPLLDLNVTAVPLDAQNTTFRFEAKAAPEKEGVTFAWDFGDRTDRAAGAVVEHTYQYPGGAYLVRVEATLQQPRDVVRREYPVITGDGDNEAPLLYLKADKRLTTNGDAIFFDASQTMDEDGDPLFFQWDFNAPIDASGMGSMENLGNQQYGRYPSQKPAPTSTGADPGPDGGGDSMTPSGHDWNEEVAKAHDRLVRHLGIDRLDGDHGGGMHEERNPGYDGQIADESPIQFHAYPDPAVYYVHVKVRDIKGAFDEGFLRVMIQSSVPPASNTTGGAGRLEAAAIGDAVAAQRADVNDRAAYPFLYKHPAKSALTLNFTVTPEPADKKVGVWLCGKGTYSECRTTNKASLAEGESGRVLTWEITPAEVPPEYTYTLYVGNLGNSIVDYEIRVDSLFDLNPWAKEEAGYATGG